MAIFTLEFRVGNQVISSITITQPHIPFNFLNNVSVIIGGPSAIRAYQNDAPRAHFGPGVNVQNSHQMALATLQRFIWRWTTSS